MTTGHMTDHAHPPERDYDQEEQAQKEIANVAPNIVEGRQDAQRVRTLEVEVAPVLVTTDIQDLSTQRGKLKQQSHYQIMH